MTREDAVKGLRNVADWHYGKYEQTHEEDYLNDGDFLTVVANMLKAQEPRVVAWQDVIGAAIECKPLYIEVKDSDDKESGDDRWAMVTQYKDSITNGMIRAMSSYVTSEVLFAEDYGKRWRCWTSRPDQATREATPWNAQK